MIDGIKYIGDGEFSVSLERLVSLLEAQIIALRTGVMLSVMPWIGRSMHTM